MAPYFYDDLASPSTTIRVLELLPAQPWEPLFFNFLVVYIRPSQLSIDPPQLPNKMYATYEALSYVWGTTTLVCKITHQASSTTISITIRLFVALQHLRLRDKKRYLWVDALCINQRNDAEKSSQISQMGRIYANASQVIVWLNNMDGRKGSAIIKDFVDIAHRHSLEIDMISGRIIRGEEAMEEAISLSNKIDGKELEKWYSHEWYWRVWTLQEFCLATDLRLVCGNSYVSYDDFLKATSTLKLIYDLRHPNAISRLQKNMSMINLHQVHLLAWDRFQIRECLTRRTASIMPSLQHESSSLNPLKERLASYQPAPLQSRFTKANVFRFCVARVEGGLQCRNELDCVYGMLSLGEDGASIVPDYRTTPQKLWKQLSEHTLRSGDLSVLHFAGICNNGPFSKLESWVADLGLNKSLKTVKFGGEGRPRFAAGMRPDCPPDIHVSENKLLLHGVIVDIISAFTTLETTDDSGKIDTTEHQVIPFRSLLHMVSLLNNELNQWLADAPQWPYREDRLWALARTIFADQRTQKGQHFCDIRSPEAIYVLFFWIMNCRLNEIEDSGSFVLETEAFSSDVYPFDHEEVRGWKLYLSVISRGAEVEHHCKKTGRSFRGIKVEGPFREALEKFLQACWWLLVDRRLFKTNCGYLGLGPRDIDVWDYVVVFEGGETPFIVRRTGDHASFEVQDDAPEEIPTWRLVGECYLHGFMGGEALDPNFAGGRRRSLFVIV